MDRISVIGVPSSAAAYCVGPERAPSALRAAGLVDRLAAAGVEVRDRGDLTERRWHPDPESPRAQNADEEAEGLRELVDALGRALEDGDRALVLGGACTVALGVCAALDAAHTGDARMLYIDRHLDLNTPDTTREGSLSWMGMAHALGLPGAVPRLAHLVADRPALRPADLVYLGTEMSETTEAERERITRLGIRVVPQDRLVSDPAGAAREARSALGPGVLAVHVDVDVLDFLDAPLAENVNGRGSGPTVSQLGSAVREVWSDPDCRVLSIGQLDPHHASAVPDSTGRFVSALVHALAGTGNREHA